MNSDSYFAIGSDHKVCEDYAQSGMINEQPFAIIADGCSSSDHTDIGSRLLVWSLIKAMNGVNEDGADAMRKSINIAESASATIGLPQTCLDATLAVAIGNPDGSVNTCIAGDGAVIIKKQDGSVEILTVEYASGAPHYLSYSLDINREESYIHQFGTEKVLRSEKLYADDNVEVTTQDLICDICCETFTDAVSVSVLSDGLFTFTNANKYREIAKSLVAFKGSKGEFVKRRCRRVLKDLAKELCHHKDDFSMATIFVGE